MLKLLELALGRAGQSYRLIEHGAAMAQGRTCKITGTKYWFAVQSQRMMPRGAAPPRRHALGRFPRMFCPDCGTPLTYQHDTYVDAIDIATCSLDEPERFPELTICWIETGVGEVLLARAGRELLQRLEVILQAAPAVDA